MSLLKIILKMMDQVMCVTYPWIDEDNFEMIDQVLHILGWIFGHLEDPGHERIPFDPIPFSD